MYLLNEAQRSHEQQKGNFSDYYINNKDEEKYLYMLFNDSLEFNTCGVILINDKKKIIDFNEKFVEMWQLPETILLSGDYNKYLGFYRSQLKDSASYFWLLQTLETHKKTESDYSLKLNKGRVFKTHFQCLRLGKKIIGRVWHFEDFKQTPDQTQVQKVDLNSSMLEQALKFIEANYHQPIGLVEVACAVGYSPAYLTDLMRRKTGQTVYSWITEHRLTQACLLLRKTHQSVEQIAASVGYSHLGCFFKQFRQKYGMTPKAWRNKHLASN